MPKEPRQRNRDNQPKGDTLTRNLVLGMVGLVVISGVIFTVLDRQSAKKTDFDVAIEKVDAANNGPILNASIDPADDFGIAFNKGTLPKIEVWEDPQCPFCKDFETEIGDYLDELVRGNQAEVTYRMTSFLGNESAQATNAAFCAADEGRFLDYHKAIYTVQGREGSGTYSVPNLLEIGNRLNMTSESFKSCVSDGKYADRAKAVYDSMPKYNVKGTPTVFINGTVWQRSGAEFKLDEFRAAVEAAK
jgi:protein-disulfide isomerase